MSTQQTRTLSRRAFTSEAVLTLLAGVAVSVSGCDAGGPTSPQAPGGGRAGMVAANHGHVATITSAQLASGGGVVLDIRGNADHPHTVQLTMTEVMQIADGRQVSKQSTTEAAHSHLVTFN